MKKVIVTRRESGESGTFGELTIEGTTFHCLTIERPWEDNEKGKSCIPAGTYKMSLEYSNRFKKKLWELKGVPGRSECKIHNANFADQLEGCIAVGKEKAMIGDKMGITSSKPTLTAFMAAMGSDVEATITIK